jgi:hypothetical protein
MKKTLLALAGLSLAALALAQSQYKVVFGGKTSSIAGVVAAGKLSLSSKPYATALGSSVSIDFKAKTANFTRNNKTAKVAVTVQKDIAYAPAVDVAKGLGLSAALSGSNITVTNPTPAAASNAPSVQGTTQQNGGEGVIGQTYTLCKGTDNARNFQITKLEYSVGNYLYNGGDDDDTLSPDKKGLIVYMTIQNPQPREIYIGGSNIRLSGVDSKNQNVSTENEWYEQGTFRGVGTNLRPSQKINVIARFVLDTDVSLPKLIVDDCNNAVWRFDLRGKVAPIPAPIADPAVPDGSSALLKFPAQFGVNYPCRMGTFRLDRVEYSSAAWFDGSNPPENGKWAILYFTVRNNTKKPQSVGQVDLSVVDQDGIASSNYQWLYRASRDAYASEVQIPAGGEIQVRALAEVQSGVQPKALRLAYYGSRIAELDVSNIK